MAITRPGQIGVGVQAYPGFSPKSPATSPKGAGQFTRLLSIGIGGRQRSSSNKGLGPFTRLTSMGINGRRVAFVAKSPAGGGGKGTGQFTRLLSYGIGGKRVSFEPKTSFNETIGGGTTKKKWTDEQLKNLDAFGKAQLGILRDETEVSPESYIAPAIEVPEIEFSPDTIVSPEKTVSPLLPEVSILQSIPERIEGIDTETDEDILLILALITAHDS